MARLCKRAQDGIAVRDPKLNRFSISKTILLSARSRIPVDKAETVWLPRRTMCCGFSSNSVGRKEKK